MYFEPEDEGFGPSPVSQNSQREFPTFEVDEDMTSHTYAIPEPILRNKSLKSIVLPQRLDLSSLQNSTKSSKKSSERVKKFSPIKANDDSFRKMKEPTDLLAYKQDIERFCMEIDQKLKNKNKRKPSNSSITSDRASSVSSVASSGGSYHRSLSVQIGRADDIWKNRVSRAFEDSNFNLSRGCSIDYDTDDTRPPSSEPTMCQEVVRGGSSRQRTEITNGGFRETDFLKRNSKKLTNAATNTTVFYSDDTLRKVYNLNPVMVPEDRTQVSDLEEYTRLNLGEVMPPTYRSEETPILCSSSMLDNSRGSSNRGIDVIRHHSNSDQGIREQAAGEDERRQRQLSSGRPEKSSNSMSVRNRSPARSTTGALQKKWSPLKNSQHLHSVSMPNLERFIVRPSTRDIFNEPLCIQEIIGKGVKKNPEKARKMFGGEEIWKNLHGEGEKQAEAPRSRQNERAMRPTTASAAKQRSASKGRISVEKPPFCSSAQDIDGISYSIGASEQQFIGTIKGLIPDWLPLAHRIISEPAETDVACSFRDELRRKSRNIRMKVKANQRIEIEMENEENEDVSKLAIIERTCDKLDAMLYRGGQRSRVQQLKMIQSALISA